MLGNDLCQVMIWTCVGNAERWGFVWGWMLSGSGDYSMLGYLNKVCWKEARIK